MGSMTHASSMASRICCCSQSDTGPRGLAAVDSCQAALAGVMSLRVLPAASCSRDLPEPPPHSPTFPQPWLLCGASKA